MDGILLQREPHTIWFVEHPSILKRIAERVDGLFPFLYRASTSPSPTQQPPIKPGDLSAFFNHPPIVARKWIDLSRCFPPPLNISDLYTLILEYCGGVLLTEWLRVSLHLSAPWPTSIFDMIASYDVRGQNVHDIPVPLHCWIDAEIPECDSALHMLEENEFGHRVFFPHTTQQHHRKRKPELHLYLESRQDKLFHFDNQKKLDIGEILKLDIGEIFFMEVSDKNKCYRNSVELLLRNARHYLLSMVIVKSGIRPLPERYRYAMDIVILPRSVVEHLFASTYHPDTSRFFDALPDLPEGEVILDYWANQLAENLDPKLHFIIDYSVPGVKLSTQVFS